MPQLIRATLKLLGEVTPEEAGEVVARKVFRPQPRDTKAGVEHQGDIFIIKAAEPVLSITEGEAAGQELEWQLQHYLQRLGLKRILEKAGIKPGDKVRWGAYQWEWR